MSLRERYRPRVERLLREGFRQDDIEKLYLGLRDNHFGRQVFRELGDFVAHCDTRSKGLLTDHVRNLFVQFSMLPLMQVCNQAPFIDLAKETRFSAEQVRKCLRARYELEGDETIAKSLNIRADQVRGKVIQVIKAVGEFSNGKWTFVRNLHDSEHRVFLGLVSRIYLAPLFNPDIIFNDFFRVLNRNKLITDSEHDDFLSLKRGLTLHAVSLMHNCNIILDSDHHFVPKAFSKEAEPTLSVFITIPWFVPTIDFMRSRLLETNYPLSEVLNDEMPLDGDWPEVVEVGENCRLRPLR